MTKITTFDRASCKTLQDAIVATLSQVEQTHGVKISAAGGTMDGATFTAKFRCVVTDPAAREADDRQKFSQYCGLYDLKPEHFGARAKLNGVEHKLVGFNPGRAKYPATFEAPDGKRVLYSRIALDLVRATIKGPTR